MTDEEFYYTYCQGCGMCIVDDRKLEPTIEDMQRCDKKGELTTLKHYNNE